MNRSRDIENYLYQILECDKSDYIFLHEDISRNFIIDRNIGGPDSSFSMNEQEFTEMVKSVRQAESAIGIVDYTLSEKQLISRAHSRSLYVVKDIKEGEVLTSDNVRSIRPGFGLHPKYYNQVLGTKSKRDFSYGDRFEL